MLCLLASPRGDPWAMAISHADDDHRVGFCVPNPGCRLMVSLNLVPLLGSCKPLRE